MGLGGVAEHELEHSLNHQPNFLHRELITPSMRRLAPQIEPSRHLHLLGEIEDTLAVELGG